MFWVRAKIHSSLSFKELDHAWFTFLISQTLPIYYEGNMEISKYENASCEICAMKKRRGVTPYEMYCSCNDNDEIKVEVTVRLFNNFFKFLEEKDKSFVRGRVFSQIDLEEEREVQ
jgi:hypothetical protein